ncbi:magnesium transporter MgtE [Paucilactobacillus hokkaidonensis JCM 18461]|uniref:Magnesium transporter MgtE n=2 Tax=Paucilactobacillus hokkaidonensis TaxID=1193095 RepID=A0A0A1GZN6_9LACO|nr:magnesium transporter [Paucilactobacillus hokkaidonensis]KRO09949.1 Mg2+ transporter [Paucilactobacillus hokkaidonensis]BAP85931.1 magnesium transporter MgtE [Paucilactobacillus hokkaidonensis JCM 18461]
MDELNIENKIIVTALSNQKRAVFRDHFLELHFYDQMQLFASFTQQQRQRIYRFLSPKELGDMFDEFAEDETMVISYLKEMTPQLAANVLSEMFTDNTVDILGQMEKSDLATYLNLMPKDEIPEVRKLLNYDDKTAGALMTTEYVSIDQNKTVSTAMQIIRHQASDAEIIYYLYVLDDAQNLIGVVTLRDLMISDKRTEIKTIMNPYVYSVQVDDDQEDVAQKVREYDFLAVPVVNQAGHMLGIITVDDIIDVIDEESAEDYSGLAGVNVDDTKESPWSAALHRLPWLVTLLVLGMSTASLINHFDGLVSQASILAVFISLITGTAGNAGTQSLAIAIRKISVENDRKIWRLISNEVLTGVLIGIVTAVVITIIVGVWKHNFILGGVIGISMMVAIVVANLAGSLIPILMDKIGVDPAVASGPFISTLSDLTSVMIYFSIAQLFLKYLI